MFDAIAPRYDLLNRLLSAGSDVRWRRRAVARALDGQSRAVVADACCGTGDLTLELARDPRALRVVGFDFAAEMVRRAVRKAGRDARTRFAVGDALRLPAQSERFDVVTVAFGLRNLVDPAAGIREMSRLLRPGGRLLVLEFFAPKSGAGGALFRAYFRHLLPRLGRWIGGGSGEAIDAYRYLPESVEAFASVDEVTRWFTAAGLESVATERMLFGSVAMLTGVRQASAARTPARELERCVA